MTVTNKPLKTLRFGVEFELFTLDEQGYMISAADRLISRVNKHYPAIEIKKECGKNMIEITTPPSLEVPDAMLKALEDFEAVATCAAEEKILLYAYGTYPGAFTPEFHSDRRYRAKQRIIGKQRFLISGRCIGLHIHYSLPWGVFDTIAKIIKPLIRSKNKESLVHTHNLCIAMDPALMTFTQCSPFYQGKQLGKDARVIAYRGGKELHYPDGLYANLPHFGALPRYQPTNTDLLHVIKERFEEWGGLLKRIGRNIAHLSKHGSILDNTWNPVKINAHGTIEVRGMDMNHPAIVAAVAILIKYIIKAIQEKYLVVIPSDDAIEQPFLHEGKKIFIPPDSYVRTELQYRAAYFGLADDTIHKYCTGLLNLTKNFVPKEKLPLLQPLEEMLANRETTTDKILEQARELGWKAEEELTPAEAAALAVTLSKDLYKEIIITKEHLQNYVNEAA